MSVLSRPSCLAQTPLQPRCFRSAAVDAAWVPCRCRDPRRERTAARQRSGRASPSSAVSPGRCASLESGIDSAARAAASHPLDACRRPAAPALNS
eukprot:scaffold2119_cov264-Pinguiococcus_pyrenoidosus.AAC.4